MASIQPKGKSSYLVYYDKTGRQIWDLVPIDRDPDEYLLEFQLKEKKNTLITKSNRTIRDGFAEFYLLHAQNSKHAYGTYSNDCSMIINHILPHIGDQVLQKFDSMQYDLFFNLLDRKVSKSYKHGKCILDKPILTKRDEKRCLGKSMLRKIKNLMNLLFRYGLKWGWIEKVPSCSYNFSLPRITHEIWEKDTMLNALKALENENRLLNLAVHLAFIGTLRPGETVGLTVHGIDFNNSKFYVEQTIQRVEKSALESLTDEFLYNVFPEKKKDSRTVLVSKVPKTVTSRRYLFMTTPLKEALRLRIEEIQQSKLQLGDQYNDYDLLVCLPNGDPIEPKLLNKWFTSWQKKHQELPLIPMKNLRHSGTTYKLVTGQGDIKAVQGETGHSRSEMVTDTYAQIVESPRRALIRKVENDFYDNLSETIDTGSNQSGKPTHMEEMISQYLQENPEMLKKLLINAIS